VTSPSAPYTLYGGNAPGNAELGSPLIGGSCSVALKVVGATSSTDSLIGVGYSTSNCSMCASQPHFLNCASMHSALALSCGEPTWLGSEDICFSQSRISLALSSESNFCSSCCCRVTPLDVKPSMPPEDGGVAAPAAQVSDRHARAMPSLRTWIGFMQNPSRLIAAPHAALTHGPHRRNHPFYAAPGKFAWEKRHACLPRRARATVTALPTDFPGNRGRQTRRSSRTAASPPGFRRTIPA